MIKLMKRIPSILTLLRVVLTVIINLYIVSHFGSILIPIIISTIIFLTDYFDGKIARITGSVSKAGAVFDVVSDLFYIVVSYLVLYTLLILPLWFLSIILFKFVEFIVTSYCINRISNKKSIFIFDFLGRFVAVIFYIIPVVSYIVFQLSKTGYLSILNLLMYSTTFFVIVSSLYRIWICVKGLKTFNSEAFKINFSIKP